VQQGGAVRRQVDEVVPNIATAPSPTSGVSSGTGGPGGNGAGPAPTSPEEDPEFQAVVGHMGQYAEQEKVHAPAEQKSSEAQAAAEMPEQEKQGKAQNEQATDAEAAAMEQESKAASGSVPGFNKEEFVAAIEAKINAVIPEDPEEMENIESSGVMEQVEATVDAEVQGGKEEAKGDVDDEVVEEPDESAVPDKDVDPLEPNDPGSAPADVNADGAAPKSKGPGELETPLQEQSQSLDEQMAEAEVTEEMLANSNEPAFTAALDAKTEAQQAAQEDPPVYRASEQATISQTQSAAAAATQTQTQMMTGVRGQVFGDMDTLQTDAKSEDEGERERIGREIDAIYQATKTAVETILEQLDRDVDAAFSAGAQRAKDAAIQHIKTETQAFKDERYEGAGVVLSVTDWAGVTKLPPEYYEYYNEGRELYLTEMRTVLENVADIVGQGLAQAKQRIEQGRQEIAEYVASQPEELREVAQQAAERMQGKFDELEQAVDDKENQLIEHLATRYNEGLAELDAEIEEMKSKDEGLLDKAAKALGGPLATIVELRDMLAGVLSRAADAVMMIIKDPIGFLSNLISAIGQGLENFVMNIGTHLKAGFIEWLTGTMSGAGIQLPETWDLKGIFSLVMQILGLTWDNIRTRAVGIFGEGVVNALETGFEVFVIVKNEGLPGLWEWVKDKLGDIKAQVIDGIKEMLITEVIEAGIQWLIGILGGPAGAFIKAAKAIYDIVMWFVNNAARIMNLVNAIIDSITAIASGSLDAAAQFVEQSLAGFIPTVIGFLASLIGLGDLSAKVRKIIDKIQEPINSAIDTVLNAVKGFVMKIAKLLGFGGEGKEGGQIGKEVSFSAGEESYKLAVTKQGVLTLAGAGTGPLAGKLSEISSSIGEMSPEQRGEAQGLLTQAQSLESSASGKASALAQKMQSVKKLGDEDSIAADQAALESDEDALAGVLPQLFEKAGGGDDRPMEEKLSDLNKALEDATEVLKQENATPESIEAELPNIKTRYQLTLLKLVQEDEDTYHVEGKVNPEGKTPSEDLSAQEEDLELAKAHFGSELFAPGDLVEFLTSTRQISRSTANNRIREWKDNGHLHAYASKAGEQDTRKKLTFDPESLPGEERPLQPNESNRQKFGYQNPSHTSLTGLAIIKKSLIKDPQYGYASGKENDLNYLETAARFECKRTGQTLKWGEFHLGHHPEGTSEHWNRIGHTQTKSANQQWNNDSNNYWGVEEKYASCGSGGASPRYDPPSKAAGSHRMWWDPTHADYEE
jgi:hypothetical protein